MHEPNPRQQHVATRNVLALTKRYRNVLALTGVKMKPVVSPYVASCGSPRAHKEVTGISRVKLAVRAVLLVVLACAWVWLPQIGGTLAYFSDPEAKVMNLFETPELDLVVEYNMDQCRFIDEDDSATFSAVFSSGSGYPLLLNGESEFVGGDEAFCNELYLRATRDGEQVYWGLLSDFAIAGEETGDEWEFEVKYPGGPDDVIPYGAVCEYDLVIGGYCTSRELLGGGGFTDEERIPIRLTKQAGGCLNCEPGQGGGTTTVIIENTNEAKVINKVNASSSTGGNSANGGNGGDGGNSGDSGDGPHSGETGAGGAGGNGGAGGTVVSGNASTTVVIENTVNVNEVSVSTHGGCGCQSCGCPDPCSDPCDSHDTKSDEEENETETAVLSGFETLTEARERLARERERLEALKQVTDRSVSAGELAS